MNGKNIEFSNKWMMLQSDVLTALMLHGLHQNVSRSVAKLNEN